ncbi:MAG: excinuclease ABC subunit UvrA, partial [bacterium]|nr:excinuclease ABC subunit UvrA [bacterium]
MTRKSNQEMLDELLGLPDQTQVSILAKIKDDGKSSKEILRGVSQLGYARARLNGKIMLVSEALMIASEQIENAIEVVVDRVAVKHKNPDSERILDSIETALKVGNGSIIVSINNVEDRVYNKDFVCHDCHTRISEITPRHFSFNSPEGACAHCSGLGITKEVDIDLVMPNKNLTLAEGAILPWSKTNGRGNGHNNYLHILEVLGKEYGFSVVLPVKKLSPEALEIIFYGPEKKELLVEQKDDMGGVKEVRVMFDGVVTILKRKYQEASSDYVRNDLEKYMLEKTCPVCAGQRLKDKFLAVMVKGKSIDDVVKMDLVKFVAFLEELAGDSKADRSKRDIAAPLIKEMKLKTEALINVGLEYLSLSRGANSISGGEAQRIRLATQIGSELMGITYVLDEPSIGLHNRDTEKLISTMQALKEAGNSLIVVEHDDDIIRKADWIIDMGPGAGEEGGQVIFQGDFKKL